MKRKKLLILLSSVFICIGITLVIWSLQRNYSFTSLFGAQDGSSNQTKAITPEDVINSMLGTTDNASKKHNTKNSKNRSDADDEVNFLVAPEVLEQIKVEPHTRDGLVYRYKIKLSESNLEWTNTFNEPRVGDIIHFKVRDNLVLKVKVSSVQVKPQKILLSGLLVDTAAGSAEIIYRESILYAFLRAGSLQRQFVITYDAVNKDYYINEYDLTKAKRLPM